MYKKYTTIEELKNIKIISVIIQNNDHKEDDWPEVSDQSLVLNTENGKLVFDALGDCCSKSYIESIDNLSALKDTTILNIEKVEGEHEKHATYDVSKWTFYKFNTLKGNATLSFRNDSNGYYNGYLEINMKETNYENR